MEGLRRDVDAAAALSYDLIVVGGGIYGAMTALEAARRGLRPLLLERDDFGGATSWNSHRIVHGGLRDLQRLDLTRFRTAVHERRWLLRHFPDFVEPLPCLMPLYGEGARRPSVLRLALLVNHLLSRHRNDGVRSDRRLESGGVLTRRETRSLFPDVREDGLRGGALWYDAVMTDSQRLLMEVLRWACAAGARCLNYVEVTGVRREGGRLVGVDAIDRAGSVDLIDRAEAGAAGDRVDASDGTERGGASDRADGGGPGHRPHGGSLSFAAQKVINCAGPWSAAVAGTMGEPIGELFRPSLAFNLLFDREAPTEVAVAVTAPRPDAHTWFLYPRGGRLYAGTAHFPCGEQPSGKARGAEPSATIDAELSGTIGSEPSGLGAPTRRPAAAAEPGATAAAAAKPDAVVVRPEQIDQVIDDINAAVPALELRRHQLLHVFAGLLPATASGSADLVRHPVIHDHGAAGGTAGLISVSGVKYTTARDVAERALRMAFADLPPIREENERPAAATVPNLSGAIPKGAPQPQAAGGGRASQPAGSAVADRREGPAEELRRFVENEAVVFLEDLVLRRGEKLADPARRRQTARLAAELLGTRRGDA